MAYKQAQNDPEAPLPGETMHQWEARMAQLEAKTAPDAERRMLDKADESWQDTFDAHLGVE